MTHNSNTNSNNKKNMTSAHVLGATRVAGETSCELKRCIKKTIFFTNCHGRFSLTSRIVRVLLVPAELERPLESIDCIVVRNQPRRVAFLQETFPESGEAV